MSVRLVVAVSLALLGATGPAIAHHSFAAEFDAEKPITLNGTVTRLAWANPHVWFYLDVKDDAGQVVNWAMEMGSPNGLMREGWTRHALTIGGAVTVEGFRAKNGSNVGNARVVIVASTGQRLFAASSRGN